MDEADHPVEWIFEKPRSDLAARLVVNMTSAVITEGSAENKKRKSAADVPAAKRQKTSPGAFDTLRLLSQSVVQATVPGADRPTTFVDVLLQSAQFVIETVDKEFSGAASKNLSFVCNVVHRMTDRTIAVSNIIESDSDINRHMTSFLF